jgi:hypothetical protein
MESKDEHINAIKELPGIGEANLKKLISSGFNSLESIVFTSARTIQAESGLGEKTTKKSLKEIEKIKIPIKEVAKEFSNKDDGTIFYRMVRNGTSYAANKR